LKKPHSDFAGRGLNCPGDAFKDGEIAMTPAVQAARNAKIDYWLHHYDHDTSSESCGLEAAVKLAVAAPRVFKTLVVTMDDNYLAVGIIPVANLLSVKRIAKGAGGKKAAMAISQDVERITGYVLGGVSPLGQKKRLKTLIDTSVGQHATVFVSGGRRGLEIELRPDDLQALTGGALAQICQ
jgi:Cys-tRNA(Pro)/Cys-tRNA(Cys) deacylase